MILHSDTYIWQLFFLQRRTTCNHKSSTWALYALVSYICNNVTMKTETRTCKYWYMFDKAHIKTRHVSIGHGCPHYTACQSMGHNSAEICEITSSSGKTLVKPVPSSAKARVLPGSFHGYCPRYIWREIKTTALALHCGGIRKVKTRLFSTAMSLLSPGVGGPGLQMTSA